MIGMESSDQNRTKYLRDNLPHNASFGLVSIADVVLSKYQDKSHNFKKLMFIRSSLCHFMDITIVFQTWSMLAGTISHEV